MFRSIHVRSTVPSLGLIDWANGNGLGNATDCWMFWRLAIARVFSEPLRLSVRRDRVVKEWAFRFLKSYPPEEKREGGAGRTAPA